MSFHLFPTSIYLSVNVCDIHFLQPGDRFEVRIMQALEPGLDNATSLDLYILDAIISHASLVQHVSMFCISAGNLRQDALAVGTGSKKVTKGAAHGVASTSKVTEAKQFRNREISARWIVHNN